MKEHRRRRRVCSPTNGAILFVLSSRAMAMSLSAQAADVGETWSSAVRLGGEQVQVLADAAARVRVQKVDLQTLSFGETPPPLLLEEMVASVATTSVRNPRATMLAKTDSEVQRAVATVFFSDLEQGYQDIEMRLREGPEIPPDLVVRLLVRTLERTERGYMLAAAKQDLSFNLLVISRPDKASISYKRPLDRDYTAHPRPTDDKIDNLTLAKWSVRVTKAGYRPQEKVYDPFASKEDVLMFDLETID